MSEAVKLTYDVSADDFTHAGEASGAIKRTLKKLGIDMEIVRRVSIAVYEGEINMVIHANGGVIEAEISPTCIEIWLKDKGPGIKDIDLAMQEGYSTARDHIRALGFGAGMGLPNIKKYTDDMKIDTEIGVGTTVYMKVNFT
ncbi:MAG: ATP-binding protein [Clostridia bacterium]|nr:ATP-binding protein [Clostridia bacterium]